MKKHIVIAMVFVMSCAGFLLGIDSNPTMSKILGDQYVSEINQTQSAGAVGTLVPTGVFGINGSLDAAAQVPNSQAVAMQVLATGMLAVVFNDGTNSYVVEYSADGSVNTDFAVESSNILRLSGMPNAALSFIIDKQDRLIISGDTNINDGDCPWIVRVNSTGEVDTSFAFTDGPSWTSSGAIHTLAMQTSGKIIAAGFNGSNSMLARYNLDGSIDSSFGANGYVILNGAVSGSGILPTATCVINSLVIDAQNNVYLAYVDATPCVYVARLTAVGVLDTTWNAGMPAHLSYLDGTLMIISMILNATGDLIVAAVSGNPQVIKAASIQSTTGVAGAFANFATSGGVFDADNYLLLNLMATSDGSVYFVGSDTTLQQMAIIRCTSLGTLDTTFNQTGVNFFNPTDFSPSGYANINSGAIAPNGQIFLAGAQLNSGITTPYLSSLYNNQYCNSVAQFPATQEQGTTDVSFGLSSVQTFPGVVSPFFGLYRASLQQKVEAVTELASGNLVVGINGYTGITPAISNMMLARLLPTGQLDGTFGLAGQLLLPNLTGTNEYITSILEDGSANLYVTGYCDAGAIFRKYTADGMLLWNSDYLVSGYQAFGCGFEGITRVLLFLGGPLQTGQINGYLMSDGSVDTSFHASGSFQGELLTTDFGLNMGPLYNGIVDVAGDIFIVYKDTDTQAINVASIFNAATNVIWLHSNIFSTTLIDEDNVRISFNNDGNLIVAASVGTDFLITVLDVATGTPIAGYTTPLAISCGTAVQLKQVIGISDNTIVLVGYDGTGEAMLAARITATGVVDITFDSQGPFPGVASIQIGNQIANYYARVASGITVQSHTGDNQGNLVMSGYEQMFTTDATPMVMRIFGEPGTTQVSNSPRVAKIPGTFDLSYNGTGIAETDIAYTSITPGNQEVRVIAELTGTQIMTVITDNNTSISYTQRLNSDSSIDTTYGGGQSVPIVQLAGTEVVQNMVFDGSGKLLVTGSNNIAGGYVKRLLPDGSMDTTFGGFTGSSTTSSYPLGTAYGLMDTVNACQPLSNGNIVIVGSSNGVGTIQMISSTGAAVSTFGTQGKVQSGMNATSVSVDPYNNMYVALAYTDGIAMHARILKLNLQGQPVASFGANGSIDEAIANIDNGQSLRLVFDGSLRPLIAASSGETSGQLIVNRFTVNGLVDTSFHGGVQSTIDFPIATNVVVTGMVALQDNKTLISGYQQDDAIPAHNQEFVVCIDPVGMLDGSFGSGFPPGLVTFQVAETTQLARRLINMNIQANGNILLCGGEVPAINQETPLTCRFYGYPNVQSVPQNSGYTVTLPSVLNTSFNQTGISATSAIANLSDVGNIAVDSLGRALIGGITSTGLFVVARYLRNGLLDTVANGGVGFGVGGIAMSTVPIVGLSGGEIAVDSHDNVYIGGIASSHQLFVARFLPTGILDTTYFGSGGIAASSPIVHLFSGGSIAVDANDKPLVSGYTSDGKVVATRFLSNGIVDTSFAASSSNIASIAIPSLMSGGDIVIDAFNNIYLGGMTSSNTMFIIMLNAAGLVHEAFGTSGIASTPEITGLLEGGAIALTHDAGIVIGGVTTNQTFVVARFLANGTLNVEFNPAGSVPGIAYSNPVDVLRTFGNIAVDSQNNIVVGGVASNYDHSKSMIAARFTPDGNLDLVFTSVGMATTGPISQLVTGGFVGTDVYDNIFIGGLTNIPGFVMAQMYCGEEIFVDNLATLNSIDLKIFYYGNNPQYLVRVLSPEYYAQFISDPTARQDVLARVAETLALYVATYSGQPGWNLVWHLYRALGDFDADRVILVLSHADSAEQINEFFSKLQTRIIGMEFSS